MPVASEGEGSQQVLGNALYPIPTGFCASFLQLGKDWREDAPGVERKLAATRAEFPAVHLCKYRPMGLMLPGKEGAAGRLDRALPWLYPRCLHGFPPLLGPALILIPRTRSHSREFNLTAPPPPSAPPGGRGPLTEAHAPVPASPSNSQNKDASNIQAELNLRAKATARRKHNHEFLALPALGGS